MIKLITSIFDRKDKENFIMKTKKLVSLAMAVVIGACCLAPVTAFATDASETGEGTGSILFQCTDVPDECSSRTIGVYVLLSPNSEVYGKALLNNLNGWSEEVELEAGVTYYCTYALTNDPSLDYPVTPDDDMYFIEVVAGETVTVDLNISTLSWYESVVGTARYYTKVDTIAVEDGYDITRTGQIGTYLSVPADFDLDVEIYAQNLFTGDIVTFSLISMNDYADIETNVTEGKYTIVGTRVITSNDDADYTFEIENDPVSTTSGESFHVTVIDNNSDAETVTPTRDNNEVAQAVDAYNAAQQEVDVTEEEIVEEEIVEEVVVEEPDNDDNNNAKNAGFTLLVGFLRVALLCGVAAGGVWAYKQVKTKDEE